MDEGEDAVRMTKVAWLACTGCSMQELLLHLYLQGVWRRALFGSSMISRSGAVFMALCNGKVLASENMLHHFHLCLGGRFLLYFVSLPEQTVGSRRPRNLWHHPVLRDRKQRNLSKQKQVQSLNLKCASYEAVPGLDDYPDRGVSLQSIWQFPRIVGDQHTVAALRKRSGERSRKRLPLRRRLST